MSKARSHCVLWPAQFGRKLVLGTTRKWPRPRRLPPETDTWPRRWQFFSRRDRDETLVHLETETTPWLNVHCSWESVSPLSLWSLPNDATQGPGKPSRRHWLADRELQRRDWPASAARRPVEKRHRGSAVRQQSGHYSKILSVWNKESSLWSHMRRHAWS